MTSSQSHFSQAVDDGALRHLAPAGADNGRNYERHADQSSCSAAAEEARAERRAAGLYALQLCRHFLQRSIWLVSTQVRSAFVRG